MAAPSHFLTKFLKPTYVHHATKVGGTSKTAPERTVLKNLKKKLKRLRLFRVSLMHDECDPGHRKENHQDGQDDVCPTGQVWLGREVAESSK